MVRILGNGSPQDVAPRGEPLEKGRRSYPHSLGDSLKQRTGMPLFEVFFVLGVGWRVPCPTTMRGIQHPNRQSKQKHWLCDLLTRDLGARDHSGNRLGKGLGDSVLEPRWGRSWTRSQDLLGIESGTCVGRTGDSTKRILNGLQSTGHKVPRTLIERDRPEHEICISLELAMRTH